MLVLVRHAVFRHDARRQKIPHGVRRPRRESLQGRTPALRKAYRRSSEVAPRTFISPGVRWETESCQAVSEQRMYTVPQLTDYSATALDAASRDLLSALESEPPLSTARTIQTFRDRWLARKDGIAHPDQRSLAQGRAQRSQARRRPARQRTQEQDVEAKVDATLNASRPARPPSQTRQPNASTSPSPAFAVRWARSIPSSAR